MIDTKTVSQWLVIVVTVILIGVFLWIGKTVYDRSNHDMTGCKAGYSLIDAQGVTQKECSKEEL